MLYQPISCLALADEGLERYVIKDIIRDDDEAFDLIGATGSYEHFIQLGSGSEVLIGRIRNFRQVLLDQSLDFFSVGDSKDLEILPGKGETVRCFFSQKVDKTGGSIVRENVLR